MTIATMLLRAPHIGVRKFKAGISKFIRAGRVLVVTDRGSPVEVVVPYPEMVEMVDLIDEVTDSDTLQAVRDGREAIKAGEKGISFFKAFAKIKKQRHKA